MSDDQLLSKDEFEAKLRAIGPVRYHDLHPFHNLLHGGKLNKGQVKAWALNRYYYQACIPQKDAALMARLTDRELRREWIHRVVDHDGTAEGPEFGGIERWLKLTDALGLDRDYVISTEGILPGTRFAVDAYVKFVYDKPNLEAIASSLTEMFAPSIHRERIAGMLEHYSYINDDTVAYFRRRLDQAPRDAGFALQYVKDNAKSRSEQEKCVAALTFKTQVLWSQLDALHYSYVTPGLIPPGAYVPEQE